MEYEDKELLYMCRLDNDVAFTILYTKYYGAIKKCALETYKICNRMELDDILQTMTICFCKTIKNYNENKGAFFSYMYKCLEFCGKRICQEYYSESNAMNYQSISIDEIDENGLLSIPLEAMIDKSYYANPAVTLALKEEEERYLDGQKFLSKKEKECYKYLLAGDDVKTIASKLQLTSKMVYNNIGRIKAKLCKKNR